jgi:hypothetical protein
LLGEHKNHASWCVTPDSLVIWHQHFGEISCHLLLGWKYTHNLKKYIKRNKEDDWRKKLENEGCLYCLQVLNSSMFSLDALLSVKQNMI